MYIDSGVITTGSMGGRLPRLRSQRPGQMVLPSGIYRHVSVAKVRLQDGHRLCFELQKDGLHLVYLHKLRFA